MWRRKALIALLLLSMLPSATAQFLSVPHSARSGAMGGCFLPDSQARHVDIGYRQGFLLAGMADKQISMVWPTGNVGVAVAAYTHHGNLDYHEQQAVAGYAVRPLSWLLTGVAIHYLNLGTSDPHYVPQHWLAAGVYADAALGSHTALALKVGTRPWDSGHPYRLLIQLRHRPAKGLLAVMEGEMEECVRARMGLEYCYENKVFFRTGLATAPLVATFGLGLCYKGLRIDLGAEVHQTLGMTPHTTLSLCF